MRFVGKHFSRTFYNTQQLKIFIVWLDVTQISSAKIKPIVKVRLQDPPRDFDFLGKRTLLR